jgi:ribosomal protein S18 acetylase RimI-like enzyme
VNEITETSSITGIVPTPRGGPITTRVATMEDLPFLDQLQKRHSKALGFFPRAQMEGYVRNGWVLVAVGATLVSPDAACASEEGEASLAPTGRRLGYVISRDRYLKRDELGVIYQLCVAPGDQRKLVGASLIKAVFERSAYGCRLYCCWCAQDLDANYFWESLGFVPIAFRAGGKGRGCRPQARVHIFWQRRINADDQSQSAHPQSATPYWYPFQTNGGAIREDRIVFPIPPGVHWRDVRPVRVPTIAEDAPAAADARAALPSPSPRARKAKAACDRPLTPYAAPAGKVGILVGGRIKYVDRPGATPAGPAAPVEPAKPVRKKRAEKSSPPKYDPKYLSAARELRDRYLERVNDPALALPAPAGKYDVTRPAHPARGKLPTKPMPLLKAG